MGLVDQLLDWPLEVVLSRGPHRVLKMFDVNFKAPSSGAHAVEQKLELPIGRLESADEHQALTLISDCQKLRKLALSDRHLVGLGKPEGSGDERARVCLQIIKVFCLRFWASEDDGDIGVWAGRTMRYRDWREHRSSQRFDRGERRPQRIDELRKIFLGDR